MNFAVAIKVSNKINDDISFDQNKSNKSSQGLKFKVVSASSKRFFSSST